MKKFLKLMSILLVTILFFGCGNNNTAQVKLATKKLNNSLDSIIKDANKLQTIDESKIDLTETLQNYYFTKQSDYTNQDELLNNQQTDNNKNSYNSNNYNNDYTYKNLHH